MSYNLTYKRVPVCLRSTCWFVSVQMERTRVRCWYFSLKVFCFSDFSTFLSIEVMKVENEVLTFLWCYIGFFYYLGRRLSDFLMSTGNSTAIRKLSPSPQSLKNMQNGILSCTDIASVVAQMSFWDWLWKWKWHNF